MKTPRWKKWVRTSATRGTRGALALLFPGTSQGKGFSALEWRRPSRGTAAAR